VKVHFGPFVLDGDSRQLTQGRHDLHLTPKAFDLLAALVANRPKALSKSDLHQRLWPDTFVADANLANLIAEVRQALGDQAQTPLYIRTVHRFGYAFCCDATTLADARAPDDRRLSCWLEYGQRQFPLNTGTNIIGRDPDVEVMLDASTVSRRHAQVIVTADGATLEDLGSKNGTFLGDERIASPVALADGDTIGLGSLIVTYHVRLPLEATETEAAIE
jgi:DNA-binding winged helix-turn-helix (wHTH) protein